MKYDSAPDWDCGIDTTNVVRFRGPATSVPAGDYVPAENEDFDDEASSETQDDEATRVARMKEVFGW